MGETAARVVAVGGLAIAALATQVSAHAQNQAQERACAALAASSTGAEDLKIDEARFYANRTVAGRPGTETTLPPHCHVAGSFERRTGVDGKEYAIGFALNLPAEWNGRFLFQGGGGLNGSIREPTGGQGAGERTALEQGFAVVATDSGHQGSGFDGSFMADQQALLNFQFQANAKTTEVALPIVEAYYGEAPHHNYFVGCSTGGREGMIMAQRYPYLFDGIVSGAPAMRTTTSNLALRWISNQYVKARVETPRDPFTPAEEQLVMGALLEQCDALDGQADGLIFNRTSCDFDPTELACSASTPAGQCLAPNKAEALARAMAGPVNAAGLPVYVSYPYDSGIDDAGGLPGLLLAGGSPPIGPNGADLQSQNVDAEFLDAIAANEALGSTASYYNLTSFIGNGGKQIFYHGEADPWFSANDTVRYFEEIAEANAAVQPVDEYGRLYLVPGMAHCQGGELTPDSFDLLTPIVEWVENGAAPAAVTATGRSMPGQSRPLCPYPSYAHYQNGDAADASNYECATP
jgi:pimeloyl-ACP methyl ester carboxylesterase